MAIESGSVRGVKRKTSAERVFTFHAWMELQYGFLTGLVIVHKKGYDTGLEQQAFKLLEEIDQQLEAGVNWSIIEQIGKDCG